MREFICTRPACFVFGCFIFSSFCLSAFFIICPETAYPAVIYALIAAFLSVSVFLFVFTCRKKGKTADFLEAFRIRTIALSLAAVSLSIIMQYICFAAVPKITIKKYAGQSSELKYTIQECVSFSSYSSIYKIRINEINGNRTMLGGLLISDFETDLSVGETGYVTGLISENDSIDDSVVSLISFASEGRYLKIEAQEGSFECRTDSHSIGSVIARFRQRLSSVVDLRVGQKNSGLVRAVMLGDKSGLSDSLTENFRRLGASHLLAVSGMHLSLIIGFLELLMSRTALSVRTRRFFIVLSSVLFAALTGFSPSILRAAFMLIISKAAFTFGREGDSVTSLFTAVAVLIVINPWSSADIGLILSFVTTLGILTLGSELNEKVTLLCDAINSKPTKNTATAYIRGVFIGSFEYFGSLANMSISATLFSLPVTILMFGSFSVFSAAANLLLVPLTSVLLAVSPFVLLPGFLSPIGRFFADLVSVLSGVVSSLSFWLSDKIGTSISMNNVYSPAIFGAGAASAVIVLSVFLFYGCVKKRKPGKLKIMCCIISVFLVSSATASFLFSFLLNNLSELVYFVSDENECFLLRDKSESAVIDVSDGSRELILNAREKLVYESGSESPSVLILTHLHRRYISSMQKVLPSGDYSVIYLPEQLSDSDRSFSDAIARIADTYGVDVVYYECGDRIKVGGYIFSVTEYTVLSRSSVPVVSFDIYPEEDNGKSFSYIAGSERDCIRTDGRKSIDRLKSPSYAVIGSYSPVAKQSVRFNASETELILFGTEKIAELNRYSGGEDTKHIELWKTRTEDILSYCMRLR